jgi:hypothetical protein
VNDDLFALHRDPLASPPRPQADFNPLDVSPWLAMSLMQKAIRRGREEIALRRQRRYCETLRIGCGDVVE